MTPRWRILPTVVHGFLDFAAGLAFIVLALVATDSGVQRSLFIVIGSGILLYSALTDYECGIFRVLSLRLHLAVDFVLGVTLLLLPSLIEMPAVPTAALYLLGCISVAAALTTRLRAKGTAVQDLIHEERP